MQYKSLLWELLIFQWKLISSLRTLPWLLPSQLWCIASPSHYFEIRKLISLLDNNLSFHPFSWESLYLCFLRSLTSPSLQISSVIGMFISLALVILRNIYSIIAVPSTKRKNPVLITNLNHWYLGQSKVNWQIN